MIYIANAFSLQMLPAGDWDVRVLRVPTKTVQDLLSAGFQSAVGHADTAALFSALLGFDVPCQRVNVALVARNGGTWDTLIVGQITGGRLPEGATTLPEGVRVEWMIVTVHGLSRR